MLGQEKFARNVVTSEEDLDESAAGSLLLLGQKRSDGLSFFMVVRHLNDDFTERLGLIVLSDYTIEPLLREGYFRVR